MRPIFALLIAALWLSGAQQACATPVPPVQNAVIIDNSPFYSVGPEDQIGTGNYAYNSSGFIDIPYAIFDLGSATSVSSATLTWDFKNLISGSGAASITLYVGNDASGTITTSDRFMGTAIDTFSYSGGEVRTFDVTSYLNASLLSGEFFAARLEATASPSDLNGLVSGGQFLTPSLDVATGSPDVAVPEPLTLSLFGAGLAGAVLMRRRKQKSA